MYPRTTVTTQLVLQSDRRRSEIYVYTLEYSSLSERSSCLLVQAPQETLLQPHQTSETDIYPRRHCEAPILQSGCSPKAKHTLQYRGLHLNQRNHPASIFVDICFLLASLDSSIQSSEKPSEPLNRICVLPRQGQAMVSIRNGYP